VLEFNGKYYIYINLKKF